MVRYLPFWIALFLATPLTAEEILLRDGTRLTGSLQWQQPRLQLSVSGKAIPRDQVDSVRWKVSSPRLSSALRLVAHLEAGEQIVGEPLRLDEKTLYIRPTWGEVLALPRAGIARLEQLPGWQPHLYEPFDTPGKEWTGKPTFREGKLLLGREPARLKLKSLSVGKLSFNVVPTVLKEGSAGCELHFTQEGKNQTLKIDWSGPEETIGVRGDAKPELTGNIRRTGQAQRLTIELSLDRLAIDLDNQLLWNQTTGAGSLQEITFQRSAGDEPVAIDHLLLLQPVPVAGPRDWADLGRDGMRSAQGNIETFGQLMALEPQGIRWKQGTSSHLNRWTESREWHFARQAVVEQETAGEQVQLRLRSGEGLTDTLSGAIRSWSERTVELVHPLLGVVTVPRERIEEIRFLYFGKRLTIDGVPHHLGKKAAFGFAQTQPEGTFWQKQIAFATPPSRSTLIIAAAQVRASGSPVKLLVNQKEIGTLNRLAGRGGQVVQYYRFDNLPWKKGQNEMTLEVIADAAERYQEIDLRRVWLEVREASGKD
jgi:hypothetical protein